VGHRRTADRLLALLRSVEAVERGGSGLPILAVVVDDEAAGSVVAICRLPSKDLGMPKHGIAMDSRGARPQTGFRAMTGDRLRSGSRGVVELLLGVRQVLALMASGLALAACVYYILGTVNWLWSLRDGIAGDEVQGGLVLILAALVFSGITRMVGDRRSSPRMTSSHSVGSDDRQTVVSQLPSVYRAGITLQLLALLGFVIW
jgi:hypothetical protein